MGYRRFMRRLPRGQMAHEARVQRLKFTSLLPQRLREVRRLLFLFFRLCGDLFQRSGSRVQADVPLKYPFRGTLGAQGKECVSADRYRRSTFVERRGLK